MPDDLYSRTPDPIKPPENVYPGNRGFNEPPKRDPEFVPADLTPQEKTLYGQDALRGADGKVIEQGHGAAAHNVRHQAHFAAVRAKRAAEEVDALTKALATATAKSADLAKKSLDMSHKGIADMPEKLPNMPEEVEADKVRAQQAKDANT